MCGGFFGKVLGAVDPIFKKNNPYERKKRIAEEQMAEATKQDQLAQAADLQAETTGNQAVQAELVASRRRRAAQSLLAAGNPFKRDDEGGATTGTSNLARGARSSGAAPTVSSLG